MLLLGEVDSLYMLRSILPALNVNINLRRTGVLRAGKSFALCHLALKWYRTKGNIQAEVEEMQEEQRSLSSIQTISVHGLLMDHSVRWQVITIAVVNIGMQLSGIDAVRVKSIVSPLSFLSLCLCSHCAKTVQLLHESESSYCFSSQLCSTHLHLLLSIHHSPTCSHWVTKQGAIEPRLIIFWSSLLVLPHIRIVHPSTCKVKHIFVFIPPCGWKLFACCLAHMLVPFPSRGTPHWVPLSQLFQMGRPEGFKHPDESMCSNNKSVTQNVTSHISREFKVKACLLFQRSWVFSFILFIYFLFLYLFISQHM